MTALSSDIEVIKEDDQSKWKKLNKALSLIVRDIEGLRMDLRQTAARVGNTLASAPNINFQGGQTIIGGNRTDIYGGDTYTNNFNLSDPGGDTYTNNFNLSETIQEQNARLEIYQREIETLRTIVGGTNDGNNGGQPLSVTNQYNNTTTNGFNVLDGDLTGFLQRIRNGDDIPDKNAFIINLISSIDNSTRQEIAQAFGAYETVFVGFNNDGAAETIPNGVDTHIFFGPASPSTFYPYINIGDCYDTATGYFIAPRDGYIRVSLTNLNTAWTISGTASAGAKFNMTFRMFGFGSPQTDMMIPVNIASVVPTGNNCDATAYGVVTQGTQYRIEVYGSAVGVGTSYNLLFGGCLSVTYIG